MNPMRSLPLVPRSKAAKRVQRGAALLAALIFLVVLTIIGVGVVGTTTTEEKMARNFRDNDTAFAAAEAALRDAELRINGTFKKKNEIDTYRFDLLTDEFGHDDNTCTNGICSMRTDPSSNDKRPVYDHFSLTGAPSAALGTVTGTQELAQVNAQPRYLIERTLKPIPGESLSRPETAKNLFRITSVGYGRLSAQTILQETYLLP